MPRKRVKNMPREQQKAVMAKLHPSIHVREHIRKYPKKYEKSYYGPIPKKTNYFVAIKKFIEDNPEEAKQILANIALWGGCAIAPEACPIIKGVYCLYKGRQTVFKIFESNIQYDYDLFHMIFQKQFDDEAIKSIFPPTLNILARKAEYAHYMLDKLNNFKIPDDEYKHIEELLLPAIYTIGDKVFLTDDELNENSIRITDNFDIDKNKLLNAFEKNLRKNDMSLYAILLVYICNH